MLKYRLLVGFPMAAVALGLLWADPWPAFPGLAVLVTLVGLSATNELYRLFPAADRPPVISATAVIVVLWANWAPIMFGTGHVPPQPDWPPLFISLAAGILATLMGVVLTYQPDGRASARAANGVFIIVYLGLLPSFLINLRWLPIGIGFWAVVATIFVPKVGDIGAYFTGRLIGRHPMAPILSPKKTWEGFVGGLLASVGTAVGIHYLAPQFLDVRPQLVPGLFLSGWPEAVAFGLVVGAVGVFGDLFESLLKRDAQVKDASASIPGFGGVLDVIDSVLFAAPVAYLWFAR